MYIYIYIYICVYVHKRQRERAREREISAQTCGQSAAELSAHETQECFFPMTAQFLWSDAAH